MKHYRQFPADELTMRDLLARDRTIMANERTLLAYLRTALGLFAGGVTLIKLFPSDHVAVALGLALVALGVFTTAVGTIRFLQYHGRLRWIGRQTAEAAEQKTSNPKMP